jgi:hypothetical protein
MVLGNLGHKYEQDNEFSFSFTSGEALDVMSVQYFQVQSIF